MTLKELLNYIGKNFYFYRNFRSSAIIGKYSTIFICLFLIVTLFFSYNMLSQQLKNENLNYEGDLAELDENKGLEKIKNRFSLILSSPYTQKKYVIQNNDSVQKILRKFNISDKEIQIIASTLKERKLTNIYAGRELTLIYKTVHDDKKKQLVSLFYPLSNTLSIEVSRNKDNFIVKENVLRLYKKEVVLKSSIKNNLYSAAIDVGIEPNIIIEFARIYGFEIDFQRDIRKGDTFEIYYEKFVDDNDIVRDTGKIIFSSVNFNNREINLYNFKYKNDEGYYDINGKSIVKSLMKTPINGARLSSSYGMRKHPILGYNKMHRGTDFAAPSGTPIMASGSGTVTRARWCGGGGNCVKIRHNSTYETVYAHMKAFAKGIREGKKVRQGQIIGYVGSTGMSTGPHLHYEVHVNKKQVNSQKLKLPSGKILKGDERKEFELKRIKIDLRLSELR